jgi:energy-coupling factor transporter transmembrane protein EcfT
MGTFHGGNTLQNHPRKFLYTFFYLLFSVWVWRLAIGIGIGWALVTAIDTGHLSVPGQIVFSIMAMVMGWWVAYFPARMVTRFLKWIFASKR